MNLSWLNLYFTANLDDNSHIDSLRCPCFAGKIFKLSCPCPQSIGQDNEQEVRKEAVRVIEACLNLHGISDTMEGDREKPEVIELDRADHAG